MRLKLLSATLILALAALSFLSHAAPVSLAATAQATVSATCDTASIVAEAQTLKDAPSIVQLEHDIEKANISCNGFTMKGSGPKVFGPFDLPKGAYRVVLQSKGNIGVNGEVLSGDCEQDDNNNAFFVYLLKKTLATDLFNSNGCKLIVNVTQTSGPWRLTIEPIILEPLP